MKIEFPCKFWDTKINNPFWRIVDWFYDIWDLLRKCIRKIKQQPDMLDICKCGHPFEEHDWGAYSNLRTPFLSACLVEDCGCRDFETE